LLRGENSEMARPQREDSVDDDHGRNGSPLTAKRTGLPTLTFG